MNRIPVFYIFFCILAVCSVLIIVMRWKRYVKYSNGTYKNVGQDLIFRTELSRDEIVRKLKVHDVMIRWIMIFMKKVVNILLK